jgi:DNA-binding NarL/FixJ family response regulator
MNLSEKTVILVDDHLLLRDALANLINSFDEFKVIRTTSNGLDLIEVMEQGIQPDLILLDLNMPKMDGFEVAKWLFKNRPQIPVLILTMYDSEIALIRLLQSGVRGFLKKDVHPSELRAALNAVGQGGYYYSHNTTGKLASLFQHDSGSSQAIEKATFSDKELEFLRLVSTDLTYKEIAAALKMTPRAIDGYRDTLFEKLDVKSRVGLAIYAVKNGIVSI